MAQCAWGCFSHGNTVVTHLKASESLPLPLRRGSRHSAVASFLGDSPPVCYDREGQVCNRNQLAISGPGEQELDKRMRRLKAASKDGGDLENRIRSANANAETEMGHVKKKAAELRTATEAFNKAWEAYEVEAKAWKAAVKEIEDGYVSHCRPFHDVTMQCEKRFREAMRWWFAREPMPQCPVGVVTPFDVQPVKRGFLHWLLS